MKTLFGKTIRRRGQYMASPLLLFDGVDLAHFINRSIGLSIKYQDRNTGQQAKKMAGRSPPLPCVAAGA
ncbi:hypothetical protein [Achromobacter insolitus]|uniref:hypothetical protein n=1 Tax=Achromobacter insolitus TaxID=217204 RepID=UPI0027DFABF2|nr:hypothetical protein [Achromobacter insolitus]MDQ6212240.1 hypothetical protein [Achromobacter insolitus]